MQRMLSVSARMGLGLILFLLVGSRQAALADLIRAAPGRTFPDIAGDIGGSQTYVYDPATETGTFAVVNAPHLISMGPTGSDLIPLQPNSDGTLFQSLKLKLDRKGRLVKSPLNRFEIRGSVTINERVYEGVLLEGTPTAFGIAEHERPAQEHSGRLRPQHADRRGATGRNVRSRGLSPDHPPGEQHVHGRIHLRLLGREADDQSPAGGPSHLLFCAGILGAGRSTAGRRGFDGVARRPVPVAGLAVTPRPARSLAR